MYFHALATDYDGTIAHHGSVPDATVAALRRLRQSGRRLILVTGRELPDLARVFPHVDVFDRVVAENGALLFEPSTGAERPLAPPPDPAFVARLAEREITPLSVGRSIVATWEPHEKTVLETIKEFGLELEITFNKGAVMVLPSGVNKATGLAAALEELGLSPHNVIGVGDAENDHAFMRACGCSVAVANALPSVKETADLALERDHGAGVEDLIELVLARDDDLGDRPRNRIEIGTDASGRAVRLHPRDIALVAGSSGFGKSTLARAVSERLGEGGFQFCIFDPEGDYDDLEGAVVIGDARTPPSIEQTMKLLRGPHTSVVVNTLELALADRPEFFAQLYPEIASLRARTGRPHWLIVDEAHHLLPNARDGASLALGGEDAGLILVTVHPDFVAPDLLRRVSALVGVGPDALYAFTVFCRETGLPPPEDVAAPAMDEVLFWRPAGREAPRRVTPLAPRHAHKRHSRKYAEGELSPDRSFWFRGPDGKMNLRAHNLAIFAQIAEGIDDRTWEHHLRTGDYSRWFRDVIRDDGLADEAAAVETDNAVSSAEARRRVIDAVHRRYTAPAGG